MSDPLHAVPLEAWREPESVFAEITTGAEHRFWLDAGPDAHTGWSWVGVGDVEEDPAQVHRVRVASQVSGSDHGSGSGREAGPFCGGWVGWIGYDDAAGRAGAAHSAPDAGIPAERWLRVERFVAFDHGARRVWAIAPRDEADSFGARVAATPVLVDTQPAAPAAARVPAHARDTPERYAALIERCRASIREGDAYQLCLTTRFSVAATIDPPAAFARLRAATPAHHSGFVESGDIALVSASPERFLEVTDGIVRTHPIKGTRPRDDDRAVDAALAAELRASEKERAENVMIVDLMRNDLSRVCEPGSVGVDRLLEVESYPAVHQLVSTVSGSLSSDITVGDLLAAAFPAGSMTGAPKLSAMTILHDLEQAPRGLFAGCFGWVGDDGALDLAMVIRSIVIHPGGAYVGAGGGITWRSDAAAEVAEVGIKARGPLAAIGAELPPGW
jgi:para-aminobenzoate synthetase component 1